MQGWQANARVSCDEAPCRIQLRQSAVLKHLSVGAVFLILFSSRLGIQLSRQLDRLSNGLLIEILRLDRAIMNQRGT
jgi:hypothetical protein